MKLNAQKVCINLCRVEKLELVMKFESEEYVLYMGDRDFLSQIIHSPEYRIITTEELKEN